MSVRAHIAFMSIATILAWASWLMIVNLVHPNLAAWWGFGLFYTILFLAVFGSIAVLGFIVRSFLHVKRMTVEYKASTALRQALFWSSAFILVLVLQGQRLLTWWSFSLVVLVFILIEIGFISMQYSVRHRA